MERLSYLLVFHPQFQKGEVSQGSKVVEVESVQGSSPSTHTAFKMMAASLSSPVDLDG